MIRITDNSIQPFETEHIEAVRALAAECTLLLKKDGSFPLAGPCRLAAYGSGVRKTIKGGTGSGDVNVRHFTTVEEGLKATGFTLTSEAWLDAYDSLLAEGKQAFISQVKAEAKALGVEPIMYGMGKAMPEPEYELPVEGGADAAIYVLARNSGEGADRSQTAGDIELTQTEIRDILKLNEMYETFMLVLNTGGLVNLAPVEEVKNILLLGQLGTPTGDVLADLLLGKSYPSGKLTMSWAPIAEYPSTEGFGEMDDTYYKEGIYVGYRYFDTFKKEPTYAFGYGLSYTEFALTPAGIEADGEQITVACEVKNTGSHAGREVVQVYTSAPAGCLDQPYQKLIGFAKTKELLPGESEIVRITYKASAMASYDEEKAAWVMEKGEYLIRVGNSSRNTQIAGVAVLEEDVVTEQLKNICPGWGFEDLKAPAEDAADKVCEEGTPRIVLEPAELVKKAVVYCGLPEEIPAGDGCAWEDVKKGIHTVDEFVAGLDEKQMTYLCMGAFNEEGGMGSIVGAAAVSVAGAAGESTAKLKELGVPSLVMADGPAGLRLCTQYKVVGGTIKGMDNSLAGFMDYMEPEQLQQLAAMMQQPTQEELDAPMNYVYCTAIPIGTGMAQSWNTALAEKLGDIVGEEMELFGIHLWLAPAQNIHRSPLCGRDFEYYSEDPILTGAIAAAVTKGVQKHKNCGTTIKHYAANNQETNRMASNSVVSERALREIYLKGFEIAVKESAPASIMSSYNLVNGEHTNNSRDLITHVLRDEWGYEGVLMTDWFAADDMMSSAGGRKHKHVPGYASGCIHAGNDITMPGIPQEFEDILGSLAGQEGPYPITKAQLQTTAKRVLESILKLTAE